MTQFEAIEIARLKAEELPAQEPQRGDLFIAARPFWDGPNPGGVTCRDRSYPRNGEIPLPRPVTPLGFARTSERGVTINRSPRWGLWVAVHIVLMAFLLKSMAAQNSLPSMPDPEEAVVAALFHEDLDSIHGFVRSHVLLNITTVTNLDLWRSYPQLINDLRTRARNREPAFAEALDDLLKKNDTAAYISGSQLAKHAVRLVPPETFKEMWSGNAEDFDDRLKFYEDHGDSQNLVAVSRVGLDARNELAIICFALRDPRDDRGHGHAEVFRREGARWVVDRYRRYVGGPLTTNMPIIACELRYYLARPEDFALPLRTVFTVLGASRTNLICSVPSPFMLCSSPPAENRLLGFVLQVVEPPLYAGKPMTLHFWDSMMQPYRLFQFGKRYEIRVPDCMVGDTNFDLGY